MSQPIIITGHWHSGTSCIAKIFASSGMFVGNEHTGWNADCIAQCEHSFMNHVGDQIYLGNRFDHLLDKFVYILKKYRVEAEHGNWHRFGFKITHFLQRQCWEVLYPIIKQEWPDADIICAIRHPLEVIKSTVDPLWDEKRVMESWISTLKNTLRLFNQGNRIIVYPRDFYNIKLVVESYGLCFTKEAATVFNPSKIKTVLHKQEQDFFNHKYPNEVQIFKLLGEIRNAT